MSVAPTDGQVYWVVKIRESEYLKKSEDERYMSPMAPTTALRSEAARFSLRRAKTVAHFHKKGDSGRANGRPVRVSKKSAPTAQAAAEGNCVAVSQLICKACGHNMGRSRCTPVDLGWQVRCNGCKSWWMITIEKPKKKRKKK